MYGDAGMGAAMIIGPAFFFWIVLGVPLWRILTRAGFSGWWILLALVPPVGFTVIVLILAFAEWPVHRSRAAGEPGAGA